MLQNNWSATNRNRIVERQAWVWSSMLGAGCDRKGGEGGAGLLNSHHCIAMTRIILSIHAIECIRPKPTQAYVTNLVDLAPEP